MFVVVVVCLFSLLFVCLFVCLFVFGGKGVEVGEGGLYFFCTLKSPLKSFFFFLFISPFVPSPDSYSIHFCLLTSGVELSIWRT